MKFCVYVPSGHMLEINLAEITTAFKKRNDKNELHVEWIKIIRNNTGLVRLEFQEKEPIDMDKIVLINLPSPIEDIDQKR